MIENLVFTLHRLRDGSTAAWPSPTENFAKSSADARDEPEAAIAHNGVGGSSNGPLPAHSACHAVRCPTWLERATVDTIFIGRIAGAALLAIGIASWMARSDTPTPAQLGLLTGIFVYNTTTSMLLAFAGAVLKMVGILLWPAVALHAILAVWCFSCLRAHPKF